MCCVHRKIVSAARRAPMNYALLTKNYLTGLITAEGLSVAIATP
jgi:hypothetical protein